MEKYGQYRDKVAWLIWLFIIQWFPAGGILRKANQWCLLGIPGVWWIDLQVDGVRRGSLAQTPRGRLPYPGTIIASSYTSPLDVLYLAAIFDPIFTQSFRNSRHVQPISQETALANCFNIENPLERGKEHKTTDLATLVKQNPGRVIVVFPETTTSNGRGIMKLSPSLLSAAKDTKIFAVSLRYTPADVVTPIPGWLEVFRFIWRLNSRQTHCIRVRIGQPMTIAKLPASSGVSGESSPAASPAGKSNARSRTKEARRSSNFESNFFDTLQAETTQKVAGDRESVGSETTDEEGEAMSAVEKRVLDAVADDLARLGRVKRVSLGVEEKAKFVDAWAKGTKSRK
ncbi:Lysophosphatidic acid:oleoyl-CoA acyltransferase 1 [Recurvomyces mirabilis]|uniref:Lysophosphatidic acid:oleoyl-CoA acyltransferase 1 n=1 Tax=Recurvomyces mirabilis TaxID=574656 RepID=UPI002DE16A24|nr:Lysophosphatidic acid:oleoyl-CoA acyltransferase 1 [Recurvomyces mirabilis]